MLSIFKCVNEFNKNKVDLKDIGVITFYSAQKQRLYEKFYTKEKYQELKIDSVDGFQGMELPYIILSTVRSNLEGILGFLSVENRLNVSLTRAKKGLILVGDAKCLAKRPGIFRDLIKFYCSNGLILNNPFSNKEIVKEEEIFNKNLLEVEEEYDEIILRQNEMNYYGGRIIRIRMKNEKPAPTAAAPINPQNQSKENLINNNNKNKENNNDNHNNKNVDKQIKNKKEEEKKQVPEIKKKKKKKAKKVEEEENEEDEEEQKEEDLKKKGNKKWRIKNLYNKKKIAEQKSKEKEEEKEIKVEEEKVEEDKKGKKGKKNKVKQNDNEDEVKDKKNSKNKGKGKKK